MVSQLIDVRMLVLIISGVLATVFFYLLGLFFYRKTRLAVFTPNIFAILCLLLLFTLTRIPYALYEPAGSFIDYFLKPSIVVLALPLHRKLGQLQKHRLAILGGIFGGVVASSLILFLLASFFRFDLSMILSLLPKSITTPMGIEVSEKIGGIVPLTVFGILVTGAVGVVLATRLLAYAKITHPVAKGVAIGTSSHVLGTTKALEIGETEGAISSLSLTIAGIFSVFYLPFLAMLLRMFW